MILDPRSWLQLFTLNFAQSSSALPSVRLGERFRLIARQWLPRLGGPGALAIGLLVVLPPFYFSAVKPLQQRADAAQRNVLTALNDKEANSKRLLTPQEQLREFYMFFPTEKVSPKLLGKMVSVAENNDLRLNDAEYKVSNSKVGKMMQYRISLPVEGSYPKIRAFLDSLTKEIPFMAIENVQFQRKNIEDSKVRAKIKLVLYLVQES